MTYGFEAINNNGQVLVSSETRNLHFVQKLTGPRNTTVSISDPDAGILYSSNINGGIRRWRYTASCSVTPVPFFTMPTNDFYGILRIVNKGNSRWDIEIFRSGTSDTVPDLYIFADPRASTATDAYGMIVYRDDGTASFDSRLRPLVVNGAATVTHPSNPRTVSDLMYNRAYAPFCGMVGADNAGLFQSNQSNSYTITTTGNYPTKPIFSFLSIAQSQRQLTAFDTQGYNDRFWGQEYNRDYWYSYYWQFYRGAISNPITTLTGPHILEDNTNATYAFGTQPSTETNITSSSFYNAGSGGVWEQRATPSGDDGLWLQGLPWDIYFTNRQGTTSVAYNTILVSTNGYLTFNYYNYSTGTYRDPDAGSFAYQGLATASTLAAARIMIYAADNSAYRFYQSTDGTAPNRVYRIRYTGYPSSNGWESRATVAPTLVWEIQFPENKPDEMYIVFPTTISVQGGAVLGVGTSSGWQTVSQPYMFSEATITPKKLIIKKGRAASDYAANPVVKAGWGTHDFGCNYYFFNSGGGGVIGGFFGPGSNTNVGGTWPYTNETLNLADNTVIMADGTKYDG